MTLANVHARLSLPSRTVSDLLAAQSFAAVAEEWFKRHVEKKGLISAKAVRGYFTRYFLPEWSGRDFESIRRGDVTKMLDTIEDKSGTFCRPCSCAPKRPLLLVRAATRKL